MSLNRRSFIFKIIVIAVAACLLGLWLGRRYFEHPPKEMVTTQPATAPTTQPAVAHAFALAIDGERVAFPGAYLRIIQDADELSATLFTRESGDETANNIYLDMKLSGSDLATATWVFHSTAAESDDSPRGIFLHGQDQQFRPVDVKANFEDRGAMAVVTLEGIFERLNATGDPNPKRVNVSGRIEAVLQWEK